MKKREALHPQCLPFLLYINTILPLILSLSKDAR